MSSDPMKFRWSKKDFARVQQKLRDMRLKEFKNLKSPMKEVSIYLDSWVQRNFKMEGDLGEPWEPLQMGGRPTKGGGVDTTAKILQDTGRLKSSFLPFYSKSDAGVGSELPYSKTHEKGIGVPKRRILPVHKEVWATSKKIMLAYVKKVLKK